MRDRKEERKGEKEQVVLLVCCRTRIFLLLSSTLFTFFLSSFSISSSVAPAHCVHCVSCLSVCACNLVFKCAHTHTNFVVRQDISYSPSQARSTTSISATESGNQDFRITVRHTTTSHHNLSLQPF